MSAEFATWNLDVHDLGAVEDGVKDDFVAIQAAIEEAQLSRKTLHFRPQTYIVSGELQVFSDLIIEGYVLKLEQRTPPSGQCLQYWIRLWRRCATLP